MSMESELQAKYDAAVKDWKAAKQATEAAEKERDEKWKVVDKQRDGSREYHLARVEHWKADIIWGEKFEQEYAAGREKCEIAVNLMIHRHGVDSKAAQIAKHRLELARTRSVHVCGVQYLTKWYKLRSKALQLYWQLKAEGCDAAAAEILKAKDEFDNRIKNESNGKAFGEARNAANAALNKWENNDDRTDWDAAKPKYDAELKTWNAFKPKGDEYAKALEKKFYEYIVLECIRDFATEFFPNELVEARIKKLEDDNKQKTQEINDLKKCLEQKDKENCELNKGLDQNRKEINDIKKRLEEKDKENCELNKGLDQNRKEIHDIKKCLEQKDKENCELEKGLDQNKKEIHDIKKCLEEKDKENCELNKGLDQNKKEIHDLKKRLEQKDKENCELNKGLDQSKKEINDLKKCIEEKDKENCELNKGLDQNKKEINDIKKCIEQKDKENCEVKNDLQQKNKEIQGLRDDIEEKRRRIRRLEEGGEKKCEELWGLKGEIRQYVNEMYEMNEDLELKRRRIRRLEDGGEEKCEEIKRLKNEMKQNVKEMYEMKGTMGEMVECIKSLAQDIHTLLRGQCQYIAESEATARTAVEREWQLWCEHTMAERRTLQESEAAARHQRQLYNFDE